MGGVLFVNQFFYRAKVRGGGGVIINLNGEATVVPGSDLPVARYLNHTHMQKVHLMVMAIC